RQPLAAVDRYAIERVPHHLVGERVGADQVRPEISVDQKCLLTWNRATNADDTVVGLDLDEKRFDTVRAVVCLRQDLGTLSLIFGVDIHGPNETLFPEVAFESHTAADVPHANIADAHHVPPRMRDS